MKEVTDNVKCEGNGEEAEAQEDGGAGGVTVADGMWLKMNEAGQ